MYRQLTFIYYSKTNFYKNIYSEQRYYSTIYALISDLKIKLRMSAGAGRVCSKFMDIITFNRFFLTSHFRVSVRNEIDLSRTAIAKSL